MLALRHRLGNDPRHALRVRPDACDREARRGQENAHPSLPGSRAEAVPQAPEAGPEGPGRDHGESQGQGWDQRHLEAHRGGTTLTVSLLESTNREGTRIQRRRTVAVLVLGGLVLTLAGCGGGGSSSGAFATVTVTTTETTSTATTKGTDATSGDTSVPADTNGAAVDVGETATWRGDAFTVSDVETSDTSPVADLSGEKPQAENGVWLSFKITPAEDGSAIWLPDFTNNIQIRGGDAVVYNDQDSSHNNAGEQQESGEGDFLVGIDIPKAAASGAVLEINDGLYPRDYSVVPY